MHAHAFVVTCPHCRNAMSCDPRMGGHVVACPYCRGPVVTPVAAPPPPAAPQPPDGLGALDGAERHEAPRRRQRPDRSSVTGFVVIGGVAIILAAAGFGLYAAGVFTRPNDVRPEATPPRDAGKPAVDAERSRLSARRTELTTEIEGAAKAAAAAKQQELEEVARLSTDKIERVGQGRGTADLDLRIEEWRSRTQTLTDRLNALHAERKQIDARLKQLEDASRR